MILKSGMKKILVFLALYALCALCPIAAADNSFPIHIGSVVEKTGDSFNGKWVTLESIVDDTEIGAVANFVVKEVRDGKIVSTHTISARANNIIRLQFPVDPGMGQGLSFDLRLHLKEINEDGVIIEKIGPAGAKDGSDTKA